MALLIILELDIHSFIHIIPRVSYLAIHSYKLQYLIDIPSVIIMVAEVKVISYHGNQLLVIQY